MAQLCNQLTITKSIYAVKTLAKTSGMTILVLKTATQQKYLQEKSANRLICVLTS